MTFGWLYFSTPPLSPTTPELIETTAPVSENKNNKADAGTGEFSDPPEKIWIKDDRYNYLGFTFGKTCAANEEPYSDCGLTIEKHGKVLNRINFRHFPLEEVQYGLFNLLGGEDKQLIFQLYTGGVNCCFIYTIYDLEPEFHIIYDSTKNYGREDEIGNRLVPVDIDHDGVYEFRQDVTTFDYFFASHADSVFPPAVFAYDRKEKSYKIANKKFPDFVLSTMRRNRFLLEKGGEGEKDESESVRLVNMRNEHRYRVQMTFLFMIYAGNKAEAWDYFDINYDFQDKELYRRDVKNLFAMDPTYKSIYGR